MITLNIQTQPMKTELNVQKPTFTMQTTQPQIQINTEAAKLDIRQPQGNLEIDMYPLRASYGQKSISDLMREAYERGKSTVLETIGRIAQNGDRMAEFHTGEDAPVNISVEESMSPEPEVTLAYLDPPVIRYTPVKPQINYTPGSLDISLDRGTVDVNYQPGKVSLQVLQYPSVSYSTSQSGSNVNMRV